MQRFRYSILPLFVSICAIAAMSLISNPCFARGGSRPRYSSYDRGSRGMFSVRTGAAVVGGSAAVTSGVLAGLSKAGVISLAAGGAAFAANPVTAPLFAGLGAAAVVGVAATVATQKISEKFRTKIMGVPSLARAKFLDGYKYAVSQCGKRPKPGTAGEEAYAQCMAGIEKPEVLERRYLQENMDRFCANEKGEDWIADMDQIVTKTRTADRLTNLLAGRTELSGAAKRGAESRLTVEAFDSNGNKRNYTSAGGVPHLMVTDLHCIPREIKEVEDEGADLLVRTHYLEREGMRNEGVQRTSAATESTSVPIAPSNSSQSSSRSSTGR